jgi:hypothetical protein
MVRHVRNENREATLELTLAATKALVSDWALRAKQAEQAVGMLSAAATSTWTDEQMKAFAALIGQHMDQRARERSVHQQAVLQATALALTHAIKAEGEEQQQMLRDALRDVTTAITHGKVPSK